LSGKKRKTNFLAGFLTTLFFLGISLFFAGTALAATDNYTGSAVEGKTVVVNAPTANIRSSSTLGGKKVETVARGRELKVTGESRGWYRVSLAGGQEGWVAGWLVREIMDSSSGGDSETQFEPVAGMFLVIKESSVNIRSGAGTTYDIIGKAKAGDLYDITGKAGEWYKIALPDRSPGWIAGWLAEVRAVSSPSRDDPPDIPPDTGSDSGDSGSGSEPGSEDEDSQSSVKLVNIEFRNGDNNEEKLVIKSEGGIEYTKFRLKGPERFVIDIRNADINGLKDFSPDSRFVSRVRMAQFSLTPMTVRIVLDLKEITGCSTVLDDTGEVLTVTLSEPSIGGKVIVIDAGHGGYDPGAIGVTGLEEKEFNLETALLVEQKLTELGATVILTRKNDSFVSLTGRADIANKAEADVFVSIHANSTERSSKKGTSTYYYAPASDPLLYAQAEQRKSLAGAVQENLIGQLGTTNLGTLQANFAVLRCTEMPSILVESAFLSNREDEALLKDPGFREKVAQGIADGLVEYFTMGY